MKTLTPRIVRRILAASASVMLTSALLGAAPGSPPDLAVQQLIRDGGIMLASAGPFVEPGTFRVQVARKLGRADFALSDGTWLYHHYRVTDSSAEGTLVVHFKDGRVSSLALITAAAVALVRAEELKYNAGKRSASK